MSSSGSDHDGQLLFRFPWGRSIFTIAALISFGWLNLGIDTVSTIAAGKVAGTQFDASDGAYVASQVGMAFFSHLAVSIPMLLIALLAIWWTPIRILLATFAAVWTFGVSLPANPAMAYYSKSDYTEPFFILPNESAFFVPDVGDNKSSQTSFDSEQYLEEKRIPAKRFTIPHAKLSGSAFWSDYYVPAGRLIVVDRTPYSREWVSSADRGSAAKDEGFHCQSSEGLDVTVGVAIGTSVHEESAAKFLYHFGVKPPAGDRTQPEVIFTSVFEGRSLVEVMDQRIRNKVQSLVCGQLSTHTLDEDNAQSAKLMADVERDTKGYLDSVGITLDYIGWADTFTFDPKVQDAMNRVYVAVADKKISEALGPYVGAIQGLAVASALRDKFDGKLPTSLSMTFLPQGLTDALGGLFKGSIGSSPPPVAQPSKGEK